jgi:hypothetical protein
LPWFQVQRARIVLALVAGARTGAVAAQMQCDEATVDRVIWTEKPHPCPEAVMSKLIGKPLAVGPSSAARRSYPERNPCYQLNGASGRSAYNGTIP